MLSDAPRYVKIKQQNDDSQSAEDEAKNIVGFFKSNLKQ